MKMMRLIIVVCLALLSGSSMAQFKPGDVGFNAIEFKLMKKVGVKTRTEKLVDTVYTHAEMVTAVNRYSTEGRLMKITYSEMLEGNTGDEHVWNDTIKDEFVYFPDGRVKMISLYGYDIYPIQSVFEYDANGKLVASAMSGAEPRTYEYEYDSIGNILKRKGKTYMIDVDDNGNPIDSMINVERETSNFTWNKNRQLTSETFYMMGLFYYRVEYFYDKKGHLSSYLVFYDPEAGAAPTYKNTYYYNKKGLLLKMVTEEESLRLELVYEYTYY